MSMKRRIDRLEAVRRATAAPRIPGIAEGEHEDGFVLNGAFITWAEYEQRYPDGPKPLRWLDEGLQNVQNENLP